MKVLREQSSIIITMKIITKDVYSTKYVIPIALAKGKECRENIELIFDKLHSSFKELRRGIECNSKFYPIRLTFCSDGKFLLLILGLKAAQAHYSCPYCVLHKKYWLASSSMDNFCIRDNFRDPSQLSRRIGSGACPAHSGTTCQSSPHDAVNTNLLHGLLTLKDVFMDELHFFLRIWDCVLEYLIAFAELWEITW